jgi:hypothetical protein
MVSSIGCLPFRHDHFREKNFVMVNLCIGFENQNVIESLSMLYRSYLIHVKGLSGLEIIP